MLCFHAAQTGKHLLRTKNFSEQNLRRFLCPQQMLHTQANRETFVSATMCPHLPGPLIACPKFIILEFHRGLYGPVPNPLSFASQQLLAIITQKYFRPHRLYTMSTLTFNSIPKRVPGELGNSPLNQTTPGNFLETPLIETKT